MNNKKIYFLVFSAIFLGVIIFSSFYFFNSQKNKQQIKLDSLIDVQNEEPTPLGFGEIDKHGCVNSVRACANGSVIPIDSSCSFKDCPKLELEYYPEKINAKYISTGEWPPKLETKLEKMSCNESDGANGLPFVKLKQLKTGQEYCVETSSEGAAGSVFTAYKYQIQKGDELVILSFTLKYPQCDNYVNKDIVECKQERESFDLDSLVLEMLSNLKEQSVE